MPKTMIPAADAVKAARKKLPIKRAKALNEMLEFAADDKAEAYRIGAEEAAREIEFRLLDLWKKAEAPAHE